MKQLNDSLVAELDVMKQTCDKQKQSSESLVAELDTMKQICEKQREVIMKKTNDSEALISSAAQQGVEELTAMRQICEKQREKLSESQTKEVSLKDELRAINKIVTVQRDKIKELSAAAVPPPPLATTTVSDGVDTEALRIQISQLSASLKAQKSSRESSESESAKARALLTGQVATLSRENAKLKLDLGDMETSLESTVLDRDGFRNTNQSLEERIEELQLDLEMKEIEKEELSEELEEANARPSAPAQRPDSRGGENADSFGDESELMTQNNRLKDALIKLRSQSSSEKLQLTRDLKTANQVCVRLERKYRPHCDCNKCSSPAY